MVFLLGYEVFFKKKRNRKPMSFGRNLMPFCFIWFSCFSCRLVLAKNSLSVKTNKVFFINNKVF